MSTNPVNSYGVNTPPAAAPSSGAGIQSLTTADFLTLMSAQLRNQDPLNPTDSNQFLAQLAQLSTVSGINSMNSTMTNLSGSMLSSQALSSATLVGHSILTPASTAAYASGQPLSGVVQVPAGATSVTLTITDASGAVVRRTSGTPGEGNQPFSWDGTTDSGAAAPPGTYTVTATAIVNGTTVGAATLLRGSVTSVSLAGGGSGGVTLNTPELGPIALSAVTQIG